jgi:beta-lactamase superfamily II metal-dependent hydrolase
MGASVPTPTSVKVRAYTVGFGDCFLLTFVYPNQQRHMLIDFGSSSPPKGTRSGFMSAIAADIKRLCGEKLHVVAATHRHLDHISGFATDGEGTGKIIAALKPDHVIQPWTEDPDAAPDALKATAPERDRKVKGFLDTLNDMHAVAGAAREFAAVARRRNPDGAGSRRISPIVAKQLEFLGGDNLRNRSAVENLAAMGRRKGARAHYVNAGMKLNRLLPGVAIEVLGPPTLEQSDAIRRGRSSDSSEFWLFAKFWAAQAALAPALANPGRKPLFSGDKGHAADVPPNMRWFIGQANQIQANQLLELVRSLDSVLNNTSVILLITVGNQKLLFPGDAQIEDWSWALSRPALKKLLAEVSLYKVGHHGSLNATPKSLWSGFNRRSGDETVPDRLSTICSTKSGVHGLARNGTEVPRTTLLAALKKESAYRSTDGLKASLDSVIEITVDTRLARHA